MLVNDNAKPHLATMTAAFRRDGGFCGFCHIHSGEGEEEDRFEFDFRTIGLNLTSRMRSQNNNLKVRSLLPIDR